MLIPKSQKAVVFYNHNGPLDYTDIPVPSPQANEILVNVKFSGVCHSDLHAWKGDWPAKTKLPLVGGHEGAGIVVAKGSNVTNFEIGDYAGIKWLNRSCLCCESCRKGAEIDCPEAVISGYSQNGTFQQYALADAIQAAQIPKYMNLAEVAPVLCAGLTVYKALKTADLLSGEWVAISGAGGGLGTMAVQYAKAMGLRVLAIDGGKEKGDLVKCLGAEVYIDYTETDDLVGEVKKVTEGGPHGVINVSVSQNAISQSCQYARSRAKIVFVGLPPDAVCDTPVFDIVCKSLQIKGSSVGNRDDTAEALDFFGRGLIKSPIKIVGMSKLPEVFKLMEEGKILGRYVVDTSC